jgi:hypothetical protein
MKDINKLEKTDILPKTLKLTVAQVIQLDKECSKLKPKVSLHQYMVNKLTIKTKTI